MTLSPTHAGRRAATGHRRSARAVLVYLGAPDVGPSPDLPGLARAVERLVRTLAPDVVTRVTIALPPAGTDPAAGTVPVVVPAEDGTPSSDGPSSDGPSS